MSLNLEKGGTPRNFKLVQIKKKYHGHYLNLLFVTIATNIFTSKHHDFQGIVKTSFMKQYDWQSPLLRRASITSSLIERS